MAFLIREGDMRRRECIAGLGGAAAWPVVPRAQQSVPMLGYLSTGTKDSDAAPFLNAFRQGLREIGFVEGQNVAIEYRFAEFQNDKLPGLAADLVNRSVNVIATIGGTPPALVAKAAT